MNLFTQNPFHACSEPLLVYGYSLGTSQPPQHRLQVDRGSLHSCEFSCRSGGCALIRISAQIYGGARAENPESIHMGQRRWLVVEKIVSNLTKTRGRIWRKGGGAARKREYSLERLREKNRSVLY